jgi:hypothetical protein
MGSVGDSLLYLLRDGMLKRLNDDHSMGPQIDLMAKNGMLDAEAARTHPQRNCLTSALTGKDIPELDCPPRRLELEDGDIIVLASDGLQSVAEEDIASILDSLRPESRDIATALLRAVAAEGVSDQDNTSVAVIRVYQPEPEPEVAEPEVWPRPGAPPPVDLVHAGGPLRPSRPARHRNGETGRLTHDGAGSRYPVHAQAARGASCSGVLTQAEAVSCSGLAEALRRPARVAILGQSARDVTGVLRAMLGEGVVSVLPDGPAIELSFGEAAQHTATFEDGSSLSQEGYPGDNLMRHGPLFLQIEAPLPMLATMSFLALELGDEEDSFAPACAGLRNGRRSRSCAPKVSATVRQRSGRPRPTG